MGSLVGSGSVNLRPGGAAGKRVVPSREQGLKTPAFGAGALLPPGENDFGGYVIGELFFIQLCEPCQTEQVSAVANSQLRGPGLTHNLTQNLPRQGF